MRNMRKRIKTADIQQGAESGTKPMSTSPCPLLKLPLELRQKIFGYCLGHRTIHIKYAATMRKANRRIGDRQVPYEEIEGRFHYIICEAKISNQSGHESFKSDLNEEAFELLRPRPGPGPLPVPKHTTKNPYAAQKESWLSRRRHKSCYKCYEDDAYRAPRESLDKLNTEGPKEKYKARLSKNRLDITLALTCRQIYEDIQPVLWRTNTWSFSHPLAFSQFMHYRTTEQANLMRRLHLDFDRRYFWEPEFFSTGWRDVLHKSVLQRFKHLDTLHLDILGDALVRSSGDGWIRRTYLPNITEYITDLQFLPLKHLSIISFNLADPRHEAMSFQENLDAVDKLRSTLLDFQGIKEKKRRKEAKEARKKARALMGGSTGSKQG